MNDPIDRARLNALGAIERSEQLYRLAFVAACVIEALLLAGLLLATNLRDRTHLVLLIGFVGGYSICVMAIAALAAHVTRMTQRVLKAIDAGLAGGRPSA